MTISSGTSILCVPLERIIELGHHQMERDRSLHALPSDPPEPHLHCMPSSRLMHLGKLRPRRLEKISIHNTTYYNRSVISLPFLPPALRTHLCPLLACARARDCDGLPRSCPRGRFIGDEFRHPRRLRGQLLAMARGRGEHGEVPCDNRQGSVETENKRIVVRWGVHVLIGRVPCHSGSFCWAKGGVLRKTEHCATYTNE